MSRVFTAKWGGWLWFNELLVASFPGSPRARTKSGKERGEPGKIYHVRNVIGRENLITCGRTNEHAHALLLVQWRKLYG